MTEMKRRGGRPRKPPESHLTEQLWLYTTKAEADEVMRAAIRAGKSVSAFLHERVFPQEKTPSTAATTAGRAT